MKKINNKNNNEIDNVLYSLFQEMLEDGVEAGLLTYLLSKHAMEIALSSCNEADKVIFNVLNGILRVVAEKNDTRPKCLSTENDKALNDNNPKKLTVQ